MTFALTRRGSPILKPFSPPAKSWLAAMAGAVLLAGCQPGAKSASKEPLLVDVIAAEVKEFSPRITLTGEIQANVTSDLAFQTSGQVLERFVEVGERVAAGQVLARLSASEQIADRDAAEAALAAAQFGLEQANTNLRRQQGLLDKGITTRTDYDEAVESVSTTTSTLKAAQVDYESALDAIDHTELKAFSDGIVTARKIDVGQVVQTGQPAFTVAADGPREAVFDVDEGVLTETFAAQDFIVRSESDDSVTATARLQEISPTIDKTSGSVEIKLALSSTPAEMSLGSVVTTSGQYSRVSAMVLPAAALTSEGGQPAVWVLDPQTHVASRRRVELAAFDNNSLVVAAGVEPGELVVTAGANLVFPGQTVRISQQP